MNKQTFLDGLRSALAQLPADEIDKTLSYFGEIIDDRMEEGMSEEEAVASMESIDVLAARIINDAPVMGKAVRKAKKSGISSAVWIVLAVIGFPVWFPLLMAIFAVIISMFVVLIALIISLMAVVIGLGVGGIVTIIGGLFSGILSGYGVLFVVGTGFLLAGIAILLCFPVFYLIKALWAGMKALGRKIRSWFKR